VSLVGLPALPYAKLLAGLVMLLRRLLVVAVV
jgi:hypothetical protein